MRHAAPRRSLLAALALAAAGAAVPVAARAQPVEAPTPEQVAEGREHFERGVALFDQGNHDGALVEFQRAWELSRRPSVLFNIAATCQALHRYAEAIDALERFLASARDVRQRRRAERTLRELRDLIAFVRITADPPDATLSLDGRVQRPNGEVVVGPGTHRVEATRAGRNGASAEFTIASGEHREVRLSLTEGGVSTPTVVIVDPTRTPAPPVPPPVVASTVEVVGAPPNASIMVDGAPGPRQGPLAMSPGSHRVSVTAPGVQPWSGDVVVRPSTLHHLTLSLAPEARGPRPVWFWVASAATGALLIATVATGVAALNTHSDYEALPAGSPELDALATRGRGLSIAADVLGVATIAAGATAAVLFTRTEFRAGASTARFSAAPVAGGALASASVRF